MPVYCGFEEERPSKRPPSILWIGLDKPGQLNLALTASRTLNIRDEPAQLAYPSLGLLLGPSSPLSRTLVDMGDSVIELLQRGLPQNANIYTESILRGPCEH